MKRILLGTLMVLAAGLLYAQSIPKDGKIYALGYGGKTDVALNAVITAVNTDRRTVVISGGEWAINDDVTIPTNITLEVTGDSYFNIANGEVLTINGTLDAEPTVLFTGAGTAAGSAVFLWRCAVWGDTNQYNIGVGLIDFGSGLEAVLENSQDAGQYSGTNFNLVQGNTGDFGTVIGNTGIFDVVTINGAFLVPSNDMAVSFNGYPKVALATNQATSYSYGGGTAYSMSNIALTIDGNWSTSSTTNRLYDNDGELVDFDLGEYYTGWLVCKLKHRWVADTALFGIFYGSEATSRGGAFKMSTSIAASAQIIRTSDDGTNAVLTTVAIPFIGRYVGYGGAVGATDDDAYYSIFEFNVYGTSNNFRNVTGGY